MKKTLQLGLLFIGALALTFTLALAEGKCGNSQQGMMNGDNRCGNAQNEMKRGDGKCGNSQKEVKPNDGRCGTGQSSKQKIKPAAKCETGKCGQGKCGN